MFNKKQINTKEIDKTKINEVMILSKKVLQVLYIILLILGAYTIIKIVKELTIITFIKSILKIIAPLFIGFIFAWLFDPIVSWLKKKKINRTLGALIVYFVFIGLIIVIVCSIIPVLSEQINDFVVMIPDVFDKLKLWVDGIFDKIASTGNIDVSNIEAEMFAKLEEISSNLVASLPTILVSFVTSFISGIGTFVVGLIIGFFLLVSFDNASDTILPLIPKKMRTDARSLFSTIDICLRNFVKGALLDSTIVFVISSICFWIFGLKGAIIFGLFCGLTNIIPYAGPYIGGAPAVIVGFSQDFTVGILTLISIVVIQFFEGNFFQPLVMSKTTKLHPVSIIIGLLIFGYFWGIIGMLIATPVIAILKAIIIFLSNKFDILNYD